MFKTVIAVSLLALAGCGPFWVNPFITVEESHLNWVEIHYYNMNREPHRRISVFKHITIIHDFTAPGNGFWILNNTTCINWNMFRTCHIRINNGFNLTSIPKCFVTVEF